MRAITRRDVKRLFPKRPAWSHKGRFGKLLVIGGSHRYTGSPALVALAAIRSGTDLTLVASPKRAANIIAGLQPDLITEPLHCEHLCSRDIGPLRRLADWADAVVIGGGLDRRETTYGTIRMILKSVGGKRPCVLDAEALRAVAGHTGLTKGAFILTPHEDEFIALGGGRPSHNVRERAGQVKALSKRLGATILLKGSSDVISDGRHVSLNKTGNPYMTKGGTGDVLAGICGSLISRSHGPFESACASAWINGAAGDAALERIGPGFLASEMADFIPRVIWG